MSKFEHIHPLMITLTNIYKSGGVKCALSDSSFDEINPSTHTCGRLFARALQKVAFVVSIAFLLGACQEAYPIPDEEAEEPTRGTDEQAPKDSIIVTPEFDIDGWGEGINADFTFGGKQSE